MPIDDGLIGGILRGDLTIAELLQHGDLRIDTIDLLDGELIIVDGAAYLKQIERDG